jgi:pimeloyl-ACP methyl ester carboxylesterase
MLATRYALMYPAQTETLILVNPIGLEDWKRKVPYTPIERWYERELKKTGDSIRAYQRTNYYDGKWRPEYDAWVDILAGMAVSADYPRLAWNQALAYEMIFTQPVCYEFDMLQPKTLLIIGLRDRTALGKNLVTPEVRTTMGRYDRLGKEAQHKIPHAELVELDDVGHLPHIESYDRFIEPLKRFLGAE